MSKRLAEFPDTRRAEMYNWKEWLDGEAHLLRLVQSVRSSGSEASPS